MNLNSIRADGWENIIALFVMVIVAVFFWYRHDLCLDPIVVVFGIGAGVVLYLFTKFEDDHPIAAFPITMAFILLMLIALYEESLVVGAVAALTTTTVITVYDVYLS
jgi:hypothetical protein